MRAAPTLLILVFLLAVGPTGVASALGRQIPDLSNGQFSGMKDYYLGLDALNAGRFREAAQRFDHVMNIQPRHDGLRAINPNDPNLLTLYGLAVEGMGDWKAAERAFAKALRYDADDLLARREHGVALARLGLIDRANAELSDLQARLADCEDRCPDARTLRNAIAVLRAAIAPS